MNLAILVVTYNCPLTESTTLQSLYESDLSALDSVHLTVWNNGPILYSATEIEEFKNKFSTRNIPITLYNTDGNFALSMIYNYWLNENQYTHYIILDHDDLFETNFFTKLHAVEDYDVIVPILKESTIQEVTSPTLREKRKSPDYFPHEEGPFTGEKISALTSGLCISQNFIKKFTQHQKTVFNENFALYSVDICFFNNLTEVLNIPTDISVAICNTIFHSQSEFAVESLHMRHFRQMELVYSGCLIRMHSRKKSRRAALLFIFRKCLRKFANFSEFQKAVTCVITKRHPKIDKAHKQAFAHATQTAKHILLTI